MSASSSPGLLPYSKVTLAYAVILDRHRASARSEPWYRTDEPNYNPFARKSPTSRPLPAEDDDQILRQTRRFSWGNGLSDLRRESTLDNRRHAYSKSDACYWASAPEATYPGTEYRKPLQQPTQADTVQAEEDTGSHHAPTTPSSWHPGDDGPVSLQQPTQADTVQAEEDTGPQHVPATPPVLHPGEDGRAGFQYADGAPPAPEMGGRLETTDEERRISARRFHVVGEHPPLHERLRAFFKKTKESNSDDLETVRRAELRNDHSTRVSMAVIGVSGVTYGPLGTAVWDERIAIFDLDRTNISPNGTLLRTIFT